MSEKKLRKLGKRIVDEAIYETIMGRACTYCGAGTERRTDELVHEEGCLTGEMGIALAKDPDVVAVLRWLEERKDWEENEKMPNWVHYSYMLSLIIGGLSKEFHVRLTYCPDCGGSGYIDEGPNGIAGECGCMGMKIGWKWTEEATE